MGRDISLDEVIEHFTLDGDEKESLRNKAGGRFGFAMMLKYLLWRGRFPRGRHEIPDDAIAHVARQIGVSAGDMGFYDVASRQARNHRAEIRGHTGFRVCTVADTDKLALWLAGGVARDGRSADHVRAELLRHCKAERIEPPTTDRVRRIVESGIRQADGALVEVVVSRLSGQHIARIEALVGIALIEILKEAALRTAMLRALTPTGTRDAILADVLFERLLLIAYGYGTNSGLRTVAAGDHGHSEEELRYTARRYWWCPAPTGRARGPRRSRWRFLPRRL